jgi:DNA recombination protein RmuC
VDAFNSAVGSLERQVLPGARKFTELGVRPERELEPIEPIDKLARDPQLREPESQLELEGLPGVTTQNTENTK